MDHEPCCADHYFEARDRRDALALQALAPLSTAYVPWTVSAMRPSGVVAVLNEILVNERRCIVELGSGVSTFYAGRLLQQVGGHLWTVEHNVRWAGQVERLLAREGLDEVVTVVHSPLAPIAAGWPDEPAEWYDQDKITAAVRSPSIDLLVVDGPPAFQEGRGHARYPAVPVLASLLAEDYTVILDDIHRTGEQEIVKSWESQLGITFDCRLMDGRIAVGRPRASFDI